MMNLKIKKRTLLFIFLIESLFAFASAAPQNTTVAAKATASLSATCTISAQGVSFGSLIMPLTTQSASSNLILLCNRAAPYTIDLAYGGVYGSGSTTTGYTTSYNSGDTNRNVYTINNSSNALAGYQYCYTNGLVQFVNFNGANVQTLYGYSSGNLQTDSLGACNQTTFTPKGWVGAYNASGSQSIGGPAYAYGMITGGIYGNHIAYSIEVPGSPSKVWNKGVNSYVGTATGVNQTLSVKATLIPSNSSFQYPAPDMYTDTVTATISY